MMGRSRSGGTAGRWDPHQQGEHEAVQEEKRRLASPRYHRRKLVGSSLMGVGATIGLAHWFDHVGALAMLPPSVAEAGGYPTAVILTTWGSIKLSRPPRQRRPRA